MIRLWMCEMCGLRRGNDPCQTRCVPRKKKEWTVKDDAWVFMRSGRAPLEMRLRYGPEGRGRFWTRKKVEVSDQRVGSRDGSQAVVLERRRWLGEEKNERGSRQGFK